MLSAGSAWRILEAEHTHLRRRMAAIVRVVDDDEWRRTGAQFDALKTRIRNLRDFESRTHRPKGVVLLAAIRGRSAEADQLLDALEAESEQCDALLRQALDILERGEDGETERGEITSLMHTCRDLMVRHIDREDTALRSYAAQLLSPEEWSRVVSSISSEVQKGKGDRAKPWGGS